MNYFETVMKIYQLSGRTSADHNMHKETAVETKTRKAIMIQKNDMHG